MAKLKRRRMQHYYEQLAAAQQSVDTEAAHSNADRVLCKVLRELGYDKLVDEYYKVDKWYA